MFNDKQISTLQIVTKLLVILKISNNSFPMQHERGCVFIGYMFTVRYELNLYRLLRWVPQAGCESMGGGVIKLNLELINLFILNLSKDRFQFSLSLNFMPENT